MSATARPWVWSPDQGNFITTRKGDVVAEVPCQGANPEDGELIVRAVNSFDGLLAACKDLIAWANISDDSRSAPMRDKALAVIAKAEKT